MTEAETLTRRLTPSQRLHEVTLATLAVAHEAKPPNRNEREKHIIARAEAAMRTPRP